MIRFIIYISYIILLLFFLFNKKYDNCLYNLNFDNFVSSALTILSIFFSFLLLLADNLTNKDNLENINSVNSEYYLNHDFLENKIKIYFSYFIFLINIIFLIILSFFNKEDVKNVNIIFLKIVLLTTLFSLIHAFFIINTVIKNNKNNIKELIKNKKNDETNQLKNRIK